ncbi:unnamed protein product [Symbiodinium sp. CCMP2592]|nr:unnamed protein product [Symbiodinium sp. CCMP2592]
MMQTPCQALQWLEIAKPDITQSATSLEDEYEADWAKLGDETAAEALMSMSVADAPSQGPSDDCHPMAPTLELPTAKAETAGKLVLETCVLDKEVKKRLECEKCLPCAENFVEICTYLPIGDLLSLRVASRNIIPTQAYVAHMMLRLSLLDPSKSPVSNVGYMLALTDDQKRMLKAFKKEFEHRRKSLLALVMLSRFFFTDSPMQLLQLLLSILRCLSPQGSEHEETRAMREAGALHLLKILGKSLDIDPDTVLKMRDLGNPH